jgi:hypothetical protein
VAASSRSDERRGGAVVLNAFAVNPGWRLAFLMGQELGPVDEGAAIILVPEKQDGYLNAEGKSLEAVTKPLTAADD